MEVGLLIEVQYKLGGVCSQSNFIASSLQDSGGKWTYVKTFAKINRKKK